MIPWARLAANSPWILGLAAMLAAGSYAYWRNQVKGGGWRGAWEDAKVRVGVMAGGALFCLGLAATAEGWVERVLWLIVGVGFGVAGNVKNYHKGTKDTK